MEGQTLWFLGLIILSLAQALVLALRLSQGKKSNPGNYGERIGKLETRAKNIEEDIGRIKDKLNLI